MTNDTLRMASRSCCCSARPAVTIGRTLTGTCAGIAPSSAPAFIVAQVIGAAIGTLIAVSICPLPSSPASTETQAQLTG